MYINILPLVYRATPNATSAPPAPPAPRPPKPVAGRVNTVKRVRPFATIARRALLALMHTCRLLPAVLGIILGVREERRRVWSVWQGRRVPIQRKYY